MSVCSMRELLDAAEKGHFAVGAFNVVSMEMIRGVILAAEEKQTPIILQVAEKRLEHIPFKLLAPMMINAARESSIPVAIQLDHGNSELVINKAMDYGFSSVMFDGSSLSVEENKKRTMSIYKTANMLSVNVEAELGVLGGSEGGPEKRSICTDPQEAVRFCSNLPIDALAVAIGNAHGHYKGVPYLNFEIIKEIHEMIPVHLVLHGGSGISDADFRKAIDLGIRKINIATANIDTQLNCSRKYFEQHGKDTDFFELTDLIMQAVYETTLHYIYVFNNKEPLEKINQSKEIK